MAGAADPFERLKIEKKDEPDDSLIRAFDFADFLNLSDLQAFLSDFLDILTGAAIRLTESA